MKRAVQKALLLFLFLSFFLARAALAKEIVIGATVALTGQYARTAQEQLNGFSLWVEEINARGGLLGQKLRFLYYDDESNRALAAELYEKLIIDDKVDLLVGPYSSPLTLVASTVAEKHHFPMLSSGAAANEIWERGYKNVFGLYSPASVYMDQVLDFAKSKRLKRVAVIYENTDFPRAVAEGVRAKVKTLKMALVFDEKYSKTLTDFTSIAVRMKTKKPDVIIGASYLPDATAFIKQAKESRLFAKVVAFTVEPGLPDFGQGLGLDAEAVMGNSQWEPTPKIPGAKEFANRYVKKFGVEPGYHAGGGYGAGQVLEAAVKKAGSLDKDKLRDAFRELDVTTAFGRYKVDSSGMQVGKPSYTIQWISGVRQIIAPQAAATAKPAYPFKDWVKR